jgi:two-component system osmolarity sensor histidine kinase EnvZ
MRDRIRHHVEQRTTMLAGVSHDLRTVLTRFKLELALLPDNPESEALRHDVNEMQHMLEDYLAFAKGDGGEEAAPTSVGELLDEVQEETEHLGTPIEVRMRQPKHELVLPLKRQAFKRAVTNLVTNAARFGDIVVIRAASDDTWLRIEVDDDGPGIPGQRQRVSPFYRPTTPATRTRQQRLGWRLPAASAATAATLRWGRDTACAPRYGCRLV